MRDDADVTATDATRLAVLIDSDNTTASLTTELLEEIAKYGTPTVKRAYGDWTTPHLVGWKEELLRHAIQPVQQFAYTRGKNSTDSALIIDAMDLLYAGNLEGFVIVSSDSDFTRLATRLRESGMTVYGLGRRSTPEPFVAACDRFIYLDLLSQDPQEPAQRASEDDEPTPVLPNLQHMLSTAIGRDIQGRRMVQPRRGGVLLDQESSGLRSPRLRPCKARRAGPGGALRRGQRCARSDGAKSAVGAPEAHHARGRTKSTSRLRWPRAARTTGHDNALRCSPTRECPAACARRALGASPAALPLVIACGRKE